MLYLPQDSKSSCPFSSICLSCETKESTQRSSPNSTGTQGPRSRGSQMVSTSPGGITPQWENDCQNWPGGTDPSWPPRKCQNTPTRHRKIHHSAKRPSPCHSPSASPSPETRTLRLRAWCTKLDESFGWLGFDKWQRPLSANESPAENYAGNPSTSTKSASGGQISPSFQHRDWYVWATWAGGHFKKLKLSCSHAQHLEQFTWSSLLPRHPLLS